MQFSSTRLFSLTRCHLEASSVSLFWLLNCWIKPQNEITQPIRFNFRSGGGQGGHWFTTQYQRDALHRPSPKVKHLFEALQNPCLHPQRLFCHPVQCDTLSKGSLVYMECPPSAPWGAITTKEGSAISPT